MINLFYSKKVEEREEVIYVDRDTHVKGDIQTNKLIVEGTITGTVWADVVVMKKGSFIKGKVYTNSLILDDDIKCDCEFHIDKRLKGDQVDMLKDRPEEQVAAAV